MAKRLDVTNTQSDVREDSPRVKEPASDAIEFAEWMREQGYWGDDTGWIKSAFTKDAKAFTTTELYKLYTDGK